MRRIIPSYLLLVVAGVLCYCLAVRVWTDVKAIGIHAFPGSPDWGGMYGSSLENYLWMSGMLFGLMLGGVVLFACVYADKVLPRTRLNSLMMIASVVIPATALVVGCWVEWGTVHGTSATGEIRSNRSIEPTTVGKPRP